ncbi:MAG: Ohr family peroxiredoxin [Alphaproteobacteria bacterium]|jgi:lipoyl-dependent peroxiredoxin
MTVLYTAHATVTGGRDGRGETDDKKLSVSLTKPGAGSTGTNPEQLFAVAYAACFGGAVAFVAGQKKLETGALSINSDVSLNQNESGFFLLASLNIMLPLLDKKEAADLVREADKICPYSKAIRNNVKVALSANGEPV